MIKEIIIVATPGIDLYLQNNILTADDMESLIRAAIKHEDKSYFFAFKKNRLKTTVTDGNNNILDELLVMIPEQIWIIIDKSKETITCTVMLPEEY
ncbi:hypothetical protein CIL03_08610 [Virgibacillus indicus]|uniref:Uncharacterized protein n=1 Tax=Virgibacillus indicus TaxID=2024554 RepID=A0A265NB58_9BACI|nr:hypothetical protein [Virgibacillus indicus]OZU89067.1 hypothetical protein CIL03_08610 [Virgibacillus indicus]